MKNVKIEKGWVGKDFWPAIAYVDIKGIKGQEGFPVGESEKNQERVIQGWKNIAVLKVRPNVPFKFGYIHGDSIHYCKETFETLGGSFGVRVGDGDVRFFVIPESLDKPLTIELTELTTESNAKYKILPLY